MKTYEENFARLEAIVEELNGRNVNLDKALGLFEEANGLIVSCNKDLVHAEQKVEQLVKSRDGALTLDENGVPKAQPFERASHAS